jgi:hypothetical protein
MRILGEVFFFNTELSISSGQARWYLSIEHDRACDLLIHHDCACNLSGFHNRRRNLHVHHRAQSQNLCNFILVRARSDTRWCKRKPMTSSKTEGTQNLHKIYRPRSPCRRVLRATQPRIPYISKRGSPESNPSGSASASTLPNLDPLCAFGTNGRITTCAPGTRGEGRAVAMWRPFFWVSARGSRFEHQQPQSHDLLQSCMSANYIFARPGPVEWSHCARAARSPGGGAVTVPALPQGAWVWRQARGGHGRARGLRNDTCPLAGVPGVTVTVRPESR